MNHLKQCYNNNILIIMVYLFYFILFLLDCNIDLHIKHFNKVHICVQFKTVDMLIHTIIFHHSKM